MKQIKLVDGIPSTKIQKLDDSITEIFEGLDKHNSSEIFKTINENNEIEIIKNKLIEGLYLAFKHTLINNRYGDLLSDTEMENATTNYVENFILKRR